MSEAERLVRQAYTKDRRILREGQDRIIVTLLEERTVRVIVVREDAESGESSLKLKNGQLVSDSNRQGTGHVLDLPAYKNDLMHALAQTGGLPSLKAKNEVKILRRGNSNPAQRDAFVQAFYAQYDCNFCMTPPPLPDDPSTVRIPLRYPPNEIPRFNPDDVILRDGDIVYIEARDTEFFYTGGLLPGGQFPIPRDYDLDILGAMAISGQGLAGRSGNVGGGNASAILGGGFGGAVPTQLYIFRKLANGKEVTISVDLVNAMNDPGQRLLVQAGDTLILRYKPCEEVLNFTLIGLFTFGIRELLN